ncbi:D-alanyl-D-alanine carboxypeptidase/D-alanyl-D-alanine endopeptidase [Rhodothermus profundi]|uniref:D-alanyl-D-alanine carboxypeptidase / D-alanyl-D-alanine-endopeptidase (Penicillin-binding protein 4) n=1 Tax=Rhodothermus profundi TaxID=633813 RepID=A0A1M6QBW2_9BACT|nr:D-alanyl-D-alanine carboxypeptidase/D-alanyl-D-alanine-endopeptidase [Rhodothermus profundi]SHK17645.1 D-alanyl-D-alanine carboxypeptidase / D-alanyl-D-alanine-endopeptidase (penicillin-binding protein 4) [Rhodothermus profundi]
MRAAHLLYAVLFGFLSTTGLHAPVSLEARLERVRSTLATEQAFWGLYVADVENGHVLVAQHARQGLLPASTHKLLTTAAALDLLGPDYRYRTVLYFNGRVEGTTLRGDLILRGSGDPTFGSPAWPGPDPLQRWAFQLARMGVRRIEGRLIGDDNRFDERPYADGWDIDYVTSQLNLGLGFAVSGLSYHDNVVHLRMRATRPGAPLAVAQEPFNYLTIENRAYTAARRYGEALQLERAFASEQVRLRGSVPYRYRGTIELPVANPTRYALEAFRYYLEQAGITVAATLVDIDDLPQPPRYHQRHALLVHFSPPLAEIVRVINHRSHNFYAEQVFRTLSPDGSSEGAARRIRAFLQRQGINPRGLTIRDGSGLSRKNLVPPAVLGQLLVAMQHHPAHQAFVASLPQGGARNSTLEDRLQDLPVRAKTGSLLHVRTLSGYLTTRHGRQLAFAFMANNYTIPAARIVRTLDQMVHTLYATP